MDGGSDFDQLNGFNVDDTADPANKPTSTEKRTAVALWF